LFGDVVDGEMRLNDAGRMIASTWQETPQHYPDVVIDSFVVMPNHVHGIIGIIRTPLCDKSPSVVMSGNADAMGIDDLGRTRKSALTVSDNTSLCEIVQRFKSLTTRRFIEGVEHCGWPRFCGRLWHRNYYERILRNQSALLCVRRYIAENPRTIGFDGQ
jgi:REP element-mobilizing transposase RayT